jgi:hypothetical protein
VKQNQTVGMHRQAKRRALVMLTVAALASASVNAAAPGTLLVKLVFAFIVLYVAGLKWASAPARPDFNEIEAKAQEMSLPVEQTSVAPVPADVAPIVTATITATKSAAAKLPAVKDPKRSAAAKRGWDKRKAAAHDAAQSARSLLWLPGQPLVAA